MLVSVASVLATAQINGYCNTSPINIQLIILILNIPSDNMLYCYSYTVILFFPCKYEKLEKNVVFSIILCNNILLWKCTLKFKNLPHILARARKERTLLHSIKKIRYIKLPNRSFIVLVNFYSETIVECVIQNNAIS